MTDPWRADQEWLRCALHAHTTNSDGELAPRALVKHYERAGYDVLAVTDHWFRQRSSFDRPRARRPGRRAELRASRVTATGTCSALGIGDALGSLEGERLDLAETGDWITENGGVAYLAHPYWTGVTPGVARAA